MSIVTIGKYKNRRITSLVFSIGHLSVIHDTHMGNPVSFDTGLTTENFFFLFCSRLLFFYERQVANQGPKTQPRGRYPK